MLAVGTLLRMLLGWVVALLLCALLRGQLEGARVHLPRLQQNDCARACLSAIFMDP